MKTILWAVLSLIPLSLWAQDHHPPPREMLGEGAPFIGLLVTAAEGEMAGRIGCGDRGEGLGVSSLTAVTRFRSVIKSLRLPIFYSTLFDYSSINRAPTCLFHIVFIISCHVFPSSAFACSTISTTISKLLNPRQLCFFDDRTRTVLRSHCLKRFWQTPLRPR